MKKRLVAIIMLAVAIGTLAWFWLPEKENSNELTLYGNVEIRQVDLSFQVAGRISEMLKEEGDDVKAGELIAILDSRDYRSNLMKAEADVARTKALRDDAEDKFNRSAALVEDGAISMQDYESFLNAKNKSDADYSGAIAQRKVIENQLAYTELYAPEDGIITIRVQEPGSNVTQGQPVYTMAKTEPVWVRAYVNEPDLGNIKYGQSVNVYTDTIDPATGKKREYQGQVGYISPVAEFTPKTVQSTETRTDLVYRIRVYITNGDAFVRQGMPVTIKVDLGDSGSQK